MTIRCLIQKRPRQPEDIQVLPVAYEKTLGTLSLEDRDDPLTELVAKQVIEIRQRSGLDFPIGDQEARVSIKKKQPQKT